MRKDLSTPALPVLTRVLGVGGADTNDRMAAFPKAMVAPAEMKEFKKAPATLSAEARTIIDNTLTKDEPFLREICEIL